MKILFLTGPHAVGKSCLMNKIMEKSKVFSFDTGPHMRKMHKESMTGLSIMEWVDSLESQYGPLITCKMLSEELEKERQGQENVIVTGFRQIEGIQYMIDYFKPEEYLIYYLDADRELLKRNYEKRENKKLSTKEFDDYLKSEEEWGLGELKKWMVENPEHSEYYKKQSNDDYIDISIFDSATQKDKKDDK